MFGRPRPLVRRALLSSPPECRRLSGSAHRSIQGRSMTIPVRRSTRRMREHVIRQHGGSALLFVGLLFGGCSSNKVDELPDGTLRVECDGGYHDWSRCFAAAERACAGKQYQVTAQISDEGGAVGVGDWSREGSEVSRTMEFRCLR